MMRTLPASRASKRLRHVRALGRRCGALALCAGWLFGGLPASWHMGSQAQTAPAGDAVADYSEYVKQAHGPEHVLELIVGRPQTLNLEKNLRRIQVADEQVARYALLSPAELSVMGAQVGTTVLNLWFTDGENKSKLLSFLVRVQPDPDVKQRIDIALKTLEGEINRAFPDSRVSLIQLGEGIAVTGQARDITESLHIMTIVEANARVERGAVNMLRITGELPNNVASTAGLGAETHPEEGAAITRRFLFNAQDGRLLPLPEQATLVTIDWQGVTSFPIGLPSALSRPAPALFNEAAVPARPIGNIVPANFEEEAPARAPVEITATPPEVPSLLPDQLPNPEPIMAETAPVPAESVRSEPTAPVRPDQPTALFPGVLRWGSGGNRPKPTALPNRAGAEAQLPAAGDSAILRTSAFVEVPRGQPSTAKVETAATKPSPAPRQALFPGFWHWSLFGNRDTASQPKP